MSSFIVTPNLLRALQRSVLGLAGDLYNGDVSQTRADQSTAGGAVNGADEIMGDFFLNWSASLEVTGKNIETVAERLGQAADGYENTDNSCMPANPTGQAGRYERLWMGSPGPGLVAVDAERLRG